jgi:hypothetical protein
MPTWDFQPDHYLEAKWDQLNAFQTCSFQIDGRETLQPRCRQIKSVVLTREDSILALDSYDRHVDSHVYTLSQKNVFQVSSE